MADCLLRFRNTLFATPCCAALTLALACSHAAAQDNTAQLTPSFDAFTRQQREAPSGVSSELMYKLLVADIALQRGEPALAARSYFEVARETQNAALARRATEIGVAA